jgi:hypothetical protein
MTLPKPPERKKLRPETRGAKKRTKAQQRLAQSIVIVKAEPRTESWWIGLDRQAFAHAARAQFKGIDAGTFGCRTTHEKGLR